MKLLHSLKFRFAVLFSIFIAALSAVTAMLGIHQISKAVSETFAAQGVFIVEKAVSLIELSANMWKTLAAVQQISSNLENMENLMVKQENGAEEAGNAVGDIKTNEEMTANIHSVTQTLVENSKNVGVLAEASENGKTGLQTVAQEIREITTHSH